VKATLALLMTAGVLAAAGPPGPKPVVPAPPPLSKKDRDQLAYLLAKAAPKAKPKFAYAAMTLAEARPLADVPARLMWQAEYEGWFVFGVKTAAGGPDEWSGVFFVRKGTNVMGYYRETW